MFAEASVTDQRKVNALITASVLLGAVLQKDLSGWEVMDLLAGSVTDSDSIFGVGLMTYLVMGRTNVLGRN